MVATMGRLTNCRRCGKPFVQVRDALCPDCRGKTDEDFAAVAEYLRRHKRDDLGGVSKATGVPVGVILGFIHSGRLDLEQLEADIRTNCPKCGREITVGRDCPRCNPPAAAGPGPTREHRGGGRRRASSDEAGDVSTGFFSYKKRQGG
jgi:uncharacterized protein